MVGLRCATTTEHPLSVPFAQMLDLQFRSSFSIALAAVLGGLLVPTAVGAQTPEPAGAPAAEPEPADQVTTASVVIDYLLDLENGFRNAAQKHGRIGSGHFEDIVSLDHVSPSYSMTIRVYRGERWVEEISRVEDELNASGFFEGEGWTQRDGHLGAGESYYQQRSDGTFREVALGFGGDEGQEYVGVFIGGNIAKPERDAIFLADIPREPGGLSSLMGRLETDEGRAAFKELLEAAKDDFEPICNVREDGTLELKPSYLNPADSPLTFMELKEFPERRELHFYPAAGSEHGKHHLLAILWDTGYFELFKDGNWESSGDGQYDGIGEMSHVELYAAYDAEEESAHWVLSSIKEDLRELHERLRLIPSETDPRVAALLGCVSGDCDDGFGELRYLDPDDHSRILSYRGHFEDGRFHGHGTSYEFGHTELITRFDRTPNPERMKAKFIGYFRGGAPITVHMPLPWLRDEGLCQLLHGYRACELWSGTLDQFNAKDDRYSIAVFATRTAGEERTRHSFIQHQTFADGRTVLIDRPFTVDFGVPVQGTCRGEEGAMRLPGIGLLEASFDAAGVAQDHAYLTLMSGEIYDVRIKDGIPLDFERVAVPEGLSWRMHARAGAWAMLQKNTCLQGDCRAPARSAGGARLDMGANPFVWSVVRTSDGSMKGTPGYLTYRPEGAAPEGRRLSFTAYYHKGVEFEKAKRREDPTYRLTEEDAWHYNVKYAHNYLCAETKFFGRLDPNLRLQGEYPYDLYGSVATAYFRDDVRYLNDYKTRVDSLSRDDNVAIEEANEEKLAAARAEAIRRMEAERAARANRPTASLFGDLSQEHISAMNSIFARPTPPEPEERWRTMCPTCSGLGMVSKANRRTVRKFEETTVFLRSWNETEVYYTPTTCPSCLGSGKR